MITDTTSDEIRILVWGPMACFTRPDLKVERVSYDVMTPSAARNIVQSIYWHPGVRYQVTCIEVLKPIKRMQLTRNEVKSKLSSTSALSALKKGSDMFINAATDIMQRSSVVLKDVAYCIHVRVHKTIKANPGDTIEKYRNILIRRARMGQTYYSPYLGCREFPARFKLVGLYEDVHRLHIDKDLGLMLYDMNYNDPENVRPKFFFANLQDGKMDLRTVKLLS